MPLIGTGTGTAFQQGTHASRPAASTANAGFFYYETDTNGGTLFQSTGSAWVQLSPGINSGALTLLATTTLASPAASISFASISGSYSHLWLSYRLQTSDSGDQGLQLKINSDTGANYYFNTYLYHAGAFFSAGTAVAPSAQRLSIVPSSSTSSGNNWVSGRLEFPFYASTNGYKYFHGMGAKYLSTEPDYWELTGGMYNGTSAITALSLAPNAGNFTTGSVIFLYGVS